MLATSSGRPVRRRAMPLAMVSRTIADLRDRFIQLAALLELELDFSEEEVEFADREKFMQLLARDKDGNDNYFDLICNIARNISDPSLMRDRVVRKEHCQPLGQLSPNN